MPRKPKRQYHMTTRMSHPLNEGRSKRCIGTHRIVLYDAIGPGPHPCHWCGRPLEWGDGQGGSVLVVDHVDGDHRNNERENLVPSCQRCNSSREHPNTIHDEELWVQSGQHRKRAAKYVCERCGETFLRPVYKGCPPVRFCSASCRSKATAIRGPGSMDHALKARWGKS